MSEFTFPIKKIIHVDMDAFYASVEQLDHPDLRYKPIAVGGGEKRGVVAAASYEARKFGVRSAMAGKLAKELCTELIFVPPRFSRYKEVSGQIREIFYRVTDLVEPLSLDEAFLDVTENKLNHPSATLLAEQIRKDIFLETGLRASAGISVNKFLAKVASDINKPNGQKTIPPEDVIIFLENLPIEKFFGVGKVTAQKMYKKGIFNGKDLKEKSLDFLTTHFKKSGEHFYQIVRGIQLAEVRPDRLRKSIATEYTFSENLPSEVYVLEKIAEIAKELAKRLQNNKVLGKTLTLKIKYSDFKVQTRSKTLNHFFQGEDELNVIAKELLLQERLRESVRLLGLAMSNLDTGTQDSIVDVQLSFDF
ncbi:DNA polymerase IV [Namhaeicola litoreus]|uniref:DNA polymerase IV n=1 Tax=Namhaeicola litoreus TaxID=1052145 RepID=A0ABW3Y0C5_9FLAO